jgi:hypothetical protein
MSENDELMKPSEGFINCSYIWNEGLEDIKNLQMKDLGNITREHLARQMFDELMKPSLLLGLLPPRPPLTRWQRFKSKVRWKIEDFRIWLSKKIYYWSDDE